MLIIVGVVLDTMRQLETFLLQRHYDGFLRKGRIRGRSASQGIESIELKTLKLGGVGLYIQLSYFYLV